MDTPEKVTFWTGMKNLLYNSTLILLNSAIDFTAYFVATAFASALVALVVWSMVVLIANNHNLQLPYFVDVWAAIVGIKLITKTFKQEQ